MTTATVSDPADRLTVDLLVIGGGMAGMSAAAYAAAHGAAVGVVEKAAQIGGSARMAAGGLACPTSVAALIERDPGADPDLAAAMLAGYDGAIDWVRSTGVHVGQPAVHPEVMGVPCTITHHDVIAYLERCAAIVRRHGGWIVTDAEVRSLTVEGGGVAGASVRDRDGAVEVRAPWTLLASGGFMNDAALRDHHLGGAAGSMKVRANTCSDGAGLRLGLAAGASTSTHMNGFYGHTVPAPLATYGPADYSRMSQHHLTVRSILLNRDGRRFTDESLGYYRNAQAIIHQPGARALMVGDRRIRDFDISGGEIGRTLGLEQVDRVAEAKQAGAHVVEADDLDAFAAAAAAIGYPGVAEAVRTFNDQLVTGGAIAPDRTAHRAPIDAAPYFAVEIQPVITVTFGGLRTDTASRVLAGDGRPIPGLLAAGADAGGLYHRGYGGGLSAALIFGLAAARTVLAGVTTAAP
ncbi:MAG: FAD-dependent oxidoreductase [Microbacteriaceae bacterium]